MSKKREVHFIDTAYGPIPAIRREYRRHDGAIDALYEFDLDYEPPLPAGAVRGNPRKQNLCFHCNQAMYFYLDQKRECVQCGTAFTFSAKEQKYWYEALGFYGTSTAIRCPRCRRKRRSLAALGRQVGAARSILQTTPDDVGALLDLAHSAARYYQRSSHGNLDEAIAAARRVRKLAPDATEALFWEGFCHLLAARPLKARELLNQFVTTKSRARQQKHLFDEAHVHLRSLATTTP